MLIIYKSNTGYTEQYAKMLAKALNTYAYPLDRAPACHKGEQAIFMGWLLAGGVVGYKKARKQYKLRAVVGVGMSPQTPEMATGIGESLKLGKKVKPFYLQGGFDINRLSLPFKLIMKVKVKEIAGRLSAKPELSADEQATLTMTSQAHSSVAEDRLAEIIAWAKSV